MKTADAWILPLSPNMAVAVGAFELRHVLPDVPPLFEIAQAPGYCRQVLLWQERIVPLMDLSARFCSAAEPRGHAYGVAAMQRIAIVAYRAEDAGGVDYGALLLHGLPKCCPISDAQASPLPDALAAWRAYTQACFQPEDSAAAIPVLSLSRLFARRRE